MSAAELDMHVTDEEFEQMVRRGLAGVLGRVELRDGRLHRMNAQYTPHFRAKMALYRLLDRAVGAAAPKLEVGVEATVGFGRGFAPLPDLFVWAPVSTDGPIPASSVRLVVEIADATVKDDLGRKRDAYAAAGLPEYWVVDLGARALHRLSGPQDGAFRRAAPFAEGATVESDTLAGVAIAFTLPE